MLARSARHPRLRGIVHTLWAAEPAADGPPCREAVLPTGAIHLVFRLGGPPLRVFADASGRPTAYGPAVVGGPRTAAYVREAAATRSVGALLEAGAASLLLGLPAGELAEQHVDLEGLWGPAAHHAAERLAAAGDAAERLDRFEMLLAARLREGAALHPAVAMALACFERGADVGSVVRASGLSHRHFLHLFRDAVGLLPKSHCRVRRFQRALGLLHTRPAIETALACGYADQPHFQREFRAIAGLTPGDYLRLAPLQRNHVPLPARVNSFQDG